MPTRRRFLAQGLATPLIAALLPALGTTLAGSARAASPDPIKLRTLYERKALSDLALSLAGQRIAVEGYMAPPLKAESRFFVLTRTPMSVCPFCETEAEWPNDIVAVYTKRLVEIVPYNVKIVATGVLELGAVKDPETGFVSLVRLADASFA